MRDRFNKLTDWHSKYYDWYEVTYPNEFKIETVGVSIAIVLSLFINNIIINFIISASVYLMIYRMREFYRLNKQNKTEL